MTSEGNRAYIAFDCGGRKSPYFEATMRWGCKAFNVYNHTFMPVHYGDPVAEYWHLLEHVTLWDVACERQVQISGPDAGRFVQWLTPRNLGTLAVGQAKYVPLVDDAGGMINDPVLLRIEESTYWLSLADSDVLLWAKGAALNTDFDIEILEPDVSPLQLQGPKATGLMRDLVGDWIEELRYFWLRQTEIDGIPVVISRTGWSNERGYEIFLRDGSRGDELWERIMTAGAAYRIQPACPNEIKRIEAGLLNYGTDMNLSNNPYEIGLGRFVDLEQEADFIGKPALRRIAGEGVKRRIMGAEIAGSPLHGNADPWPVLKNGRTVGQLSSQAYSPRLERNIGYVMVPCELARGGEQVLIQTGEGLREATLRELPFIDSRARAPAPS